MLLNTCLRRAATPLSWNSRTVPAIMPLRAKIMNPSFAGSPKFSTKAPESNEFKEQPGDEPDDVLFQSIYGLRTIELNRPKKLNSLNGSMARKIIPRLQEWSKSQLANVVVLKGAGRALCAGGDVAALAKLNTEGPEGQKKSSDYFALEYKLDHLIATYSKPYIAFMDGITMGGGVGLSVHAPFRIATENTVYAMPETTIGFFPDVGASFFLPRMEGELGSYLALTSEQLKGVDVFYHGVATHYIHSSSLPELEARLSELTFPDHLSLEQRNKVINSTIEEYVTGLPSERPAISGALRATIDDCFSAKRESIKDVLAALKSVAQSSNPELSKWAEKTAATINERSPTSVAVTFQQMRVGRNWNIAQAFRNEHSIASKFMAHPDFVEGVTAKLVRREKSRPNWQPNTLDELTPDDVAQFFKAKPSLELLNRDHGSDYDQYPHAWIGLPTEADVLKQIKAANQTPAELLTFFIQKTDGKQGVKEKLSEILERKSEVTDAGFLKVKD